MDKITKLFPRNKAKLWPETLEKILRHAWQNTEKDLTVTVAEASETRREAQNRLLWLWHGELAKHIETHQGQTFSTPEIHEYVVGKLLPKTVSMFNDDPIIMRTKTSKLNVKPFAEFLTRYDVWANDMYQVRFSHPEDLYLKAVAQDEK